MSDRRVSIQIDRLVLKGIPAEDRLAFASGLKAELARLLGSPDSVASLHNSLNTPLMRLGKVPMEPGMAGARALGRQVARRVGKRVKS